MKFNLLSIVAIATVLFIRCNPKNIVTTTAVTKISSMINKDTPQKGGSRG